MTKIEAWERYAARCKANDRLMKAERPPLEEILEPDWLPRCQAALDGWRTRHDASWKQFEEESKNARD